MSYDRYMHWICKVRDFMIFIFWIKEKEKGKTSNTKENEGTKSYIKKQAMHWKYTFTKPHSKITNFYDPSKLLNMLSLVNGNAFA